MECLFCNIIKGKIPALKVWQDENFLVILDIRPIKPGHLLLLPKSHFDDVYAIPDQLYSELFLTAKKVATTLKKATLAKRIGLIVEGFGVPHAHLHLVPVNEGNELNPEKATLASERELQNSHKQLSEFFKDII